MPDSLDRDVRHRPELPWYAAQVPRRWHFCRFQTIELCRANGSLIGIGHCACGAITDNAGRWIGRNSRRRAVDQAGLRFAPCRADRELLADLARMNSDVVPLAIRIIDGSATREEQQTFAERLIELGSRLGRRARHTGIIIGGDTGSDDAKELPQGLRGAADASIPSATD